MIFLKISFIIAYQNLVKNLKIALFEEIKFEIVDDTILLQENIMKIIGKTAIMLPATIEKGKRDIGS